MLALGGVVDSVTDRRDVVAIVGHLLQGFFKVLGIH